MNRSSNDAFNITSSKKRWKVKQKKWSMAFPLPDRENRPFQVKCKQKLWFLVSCALSLPDGNISRCNTWHCDFNGLVYYIYILTQTILRKNNSFLSEETAKILFKVFFFYLVIRDTYKFTIIMYNIKKKKKNMRSLRDYEFPDRTP